MTSRTDKSAQLALACLEGESPKDFLRRRSDVAGDRTKLGAELEAIGLSLVREGTRDYYEWEPIRLGETEKAYVSVCLSPRGDPTGTTSISVVREYYESPGNGGSIPMLTVRYADYPLEIIAHLRLALTHLDPKYGIFGIMDKIRKVAWHTRGRVL